MKTKSEPDREDGLLEALLQDEEWQRANAAGKAGALGAFRAHHRARRLTRWAGGLAALAAVMVCGVIWMGPRPAPRRFAATPREAPALPAKPRLLTDAELIAAFPEGSCFLAEVDGKKTLVFLDPEVERRYLGRPE